MSSEQRQHQPTKRVAPATALALVLMASTAFTTIGGGAARADDGPSAVATMLADRVEVTAQATIQYAVRVDNVGDSTIDEVIVTSHYPEGTTAASQSCPEGTFEPDGDICLQPHVPVTGAGESAHQVVHSRSPLEAGDGFTLWFAVSVDEDVPPGTHLPNHAHVLTSTGLEVDTNPVDTLVVPFVPRGAAGLSTVSLAGEALTDSFDSSTGSLVTEPREGDLAGNADIVLSGSAIVHGDARPGHDGGRVLVSGSARVDGSTEPLPGPIVLNEIDAGPVAAANANRLVCRNAGDCQQVAWHPQARSLLVEGRMRLSPGAYHLCRLDIRGDVLVEGPVAIWLGSPEDCPGGAEISISSGATVAPASGRPLDLQILVDSAEGDVAVDMDGQSVLIGIVSAPSARYVLQGGAALFGTVRAGEVVTGAGGAALHIDRSLRAS